MKEYKPTLALPLPNFKLKKINEILTKAYKKINTIKKKYDVWIDRIKIWNYNCLFSNSDNITIIESLTSWNCYYYDFYLKTWSLEANQDEYINNSLWNWLWEKYLKRINSKKF